MLCSSMLTRRCCRRSLIRWVLVVQVRAFGALANCAESVGTAFRAFRKFPQQWHQIALCDPLSVGRAALCSPCLLCPINRFEDCVTTHLCFDLVLPVGAGGECQDD